MLAVVHGHQLVATRALEVVADPRHEPVQARADDVRHGEVRRRVELRRDDHDRGEHNHGREERDVGRDVLEVHVQSPGVIFHSVLFQDRCELKGTTFVIHLSSVVVEITLKNRTRSRERIRFISKPNHH